ncbi:MAG: hypothetical protein NTV80_11915 [Verrucomicrobia bacterium]|nr:hypothetical protein [Verrucomicrobiota bacterium]
MKKSAQANRKTVSPPLRILLGVTDYTLKVYAGMSDAPAPQRDIKYATGVITVQGTSKPAGWEFWIYVFPNGTKGLKAFLHETSKRVEMDIHQSQAASVMTLLSGSKAAYAVYDTDKNGNIYADVEAEFRRPAPSTTVRKKIKA